MSNTDNVPFTELDFDQIKNNLKDYLKSQPNFVDYNFDGSNLSVLLDLLSYNTYQNAVYTNMAFSEMFLDSSQNRESVMSHAKELNYVPSSKQSASSILDVTINVPNPETGPSTITIPKGTRFTSTCGNNTFSFITNKSRVVKNSGNVYRIDDLKVFEGKYISEFYTVDGESPVTYAINSESVDISSVEVYVRENSNPSSNVTEYLSRTTIFGVQEDAPVFYIEPHFDNLYKVVFGRNRFGNEPINGNVVEIRYRSTKGDLANGSKNFQSSDTVSTYSMTVNSSTVAENGSDVETIEDIKFFAPKSIQIQERAITTQDYEILLKQRFPNIQTISVYGGEDANPPQYGKVIISVDVLGKDGVSESDVRSFGAFLRGKTALSIEPIFVSPQFMFVDLKLRVYYDANLTTKSSDQIEDIVKSSVINFSDTYLNKFNSTLQVSRLSDAIDRSEISIQSSEITANPIIEYTPNIGSSDSPEFEFNDALKRPYLFNESFGSENYEPAFYTSAFSIDGVSVTLQDDGLGNVLAVTTDLTNSRIFKQNVGTAYYDTGIIRLVDLEVSQHDGSSILFIGNTTNANINSTKAKILAIREKDIDIEVVAI